MRLKAYTSEDIQQYIIYRKGEKKYGERVHHASAVSEDVFAELQQSKAAYVLLGIPEAVGMRMNHKRNTVSAWEATLKMLLNTQQNAFNKGSKLYILGHLAFDEEMGILRNLDMNTKKGLEEAGKLVEIIDKEVAYITGKIVALGKKPIIVGGGHNNAYGIIKGCALGLSKPVNSINFDAHSGFMKRGRRHNGNALSYAFSEGFLNRHYAFGLHENETPRSVFNKFEKYRQQIQYMTFEEIAIRQKRSLLYYLNQALSYVKDRPFGVDVNCNAIVDVPGSFITPGGFNTNHAHRFVSLAGKHRNALYLHVSEAAPDPGNETEMERTGKLIACLITDFIKK